MKLISILLGLFTISLYWQSPAHAQMSQEESAVTAAGSINGRIININTATWQELTSLPGIGEKKARAIIAYRDVVGRFVAVEQLTEVQGVGNAMVEKFVSRVRLE